MIVYVAVNCQSDSRQGKAYKLLIFKIQKAETARAHKNKTQKYPVDKAWKNVSWKKMRFQLALNKTSWHTPPTIKVSPNM